MFRLLPALLLLASFRPTLASTAAALADEIQHVSLDAEECYRVLDLNFTKEDIKVYLASGYLIFAKPIQGARLGAVFVADAQGGDADVLLLPPSRSERASLATFTKSPNLEEHFKSAAFVFTDGTGDELLTKLQGETASKKSPEMGGLIADKSSSVVNNLISSFEVRVVYDLLTAQRDAGLFYMAIQGAQLDNFDLLYDPIAQNQILAGKLGYRGGQAYFNTWTTFQARSIRNGASPRAPHYSADNFRIESAIQSDLTMKAVTRATLTLPKGPPRVAVPFRLSPDMRVTAATVDGRPAEVFDERSLRADLIQSGDDREFLLICDPPLDPAVPHEVKIEHQGAVIRDAGNQVYFVGSRGTWYPRAGGESLSNYDLTFRYPANLTLAATGTRINDSADGEYRVTHLKTDAPVRFAGFNLGNFQSVVREHNGYRVELYANRQLESALAPKVTITDTSEAHNPFPLRRPKFAGAIEPPPQVDQPDPAARVEDLTKSLLDTLDFMTEQFGPSPIRHIAVTPIPGGFGQGFPGLVYLSTFAYLNLTQLPPRLRERSEQTFYSELLEAHEVAHQWWGNLVAPASSADDWLIEALANYSALLLLERKKGVKAMDEVLEDYRTHLLSKTANGQTIESAGPIIWGTRLESSLAPDAWRAVTYEKGTWIIHMLRRRLGDEKFLALLREIATSRRSIGTEEFRELASRYAPPYASLSGSKTGDPDLKVFFENWVYGTGIPTVKLSYAWRAGKLTGNLAQRDVDESFAAFVPVEVQTRGKSSVYWLATGSDAPFSIPMPAPPARVSLIAADALIATSK